MSQNDLENYGVEHEDEGFDRGRDRGAWGSKIGFILAAAGSAIGLGNIWKFPYITGENGGGMFVLVYLGCIALVGLPIMIAEIMMGRMTQRAPVGAYEALTGRYSPWKAVGGLGVFAGFLLLSFYSIVAGWACRYTYESVVALFDSGKVIADLEFNKVSGSAGWNIFWHVLFMAATMGLVIGGVRKGIERASKILMPLLFLMLLVLLYNSTTMSGFKEAMNFVFGFKEEVEGGVWKWKTITAGGILEALGHAFFTLSLGMGAMITYGSYLKRKTSVVKSSLAITGLDTLIALIACMVLFPITITAGKPTAQGPGFVFKNIPEALAHLGSPEFLAVVFFGLLVFAALTSAISLLEVVCSYFIDQWNMRRSLAVLVCGIAITLIGVPSALSEVEGSWFAKGGGFAASKAELMGPEWADRTKGTWFDCIDYFVSNWMLSLGGLLISIFMAWRVRARIREAEFGDTVGFFYSVWFLLLAVVIPVAVFIVMLNAGGVLGSSIDWLVDWLRWFRTQVK